MDAWEVTTREWRRPVAGRILVALSAGTVGTIGMGVALYVLDLPEVAGLGAAAVGVAVAVLATTYALKRLGL